MVEARGDLEGIAGEEFYFMLHGAMCKQQEVACSLEQSDADLGVLEKAMQETSWGRREEVTGETVTRGRAMMCWASHVAVGYWAGRLHWALLDCWCVLKWVGPVQAPFFGAKFACCLGLS